MALEALQKSVLKDKIFVPGIEQYEESVDSYWSNQEAELRPAAVLKPATVSDVSTAVRILAEVNSENDNRAPFAVRAGGNQHFAGSANIGGPGVTIDLRGLSRIAVSEDRKLVTIGAGIGFESLYTSLDVVGLSVPGGRVSRVGLAGFTLGGGISYYTSQLGFTCDNVQDFEIVLADGTAVHANANDHTDLFRALKGGGNNFGIVTSFKMKTIPKRDLWGGQKVAEMSAYPHLVKELHERISESDHDTKSAIMVGASILAGTRMTLYSLKYTEPTPNAAVLSGLTKVPHTQSSLRQASIMDMVAEEGRYTLGRSRGFFMTLTFKSDIAMFNAIRDLWLEHTTDAPAIAGWEFGFICNPIVPSAVRAGTAAGGNALGLAASDGPLVIVLAYARWTHAADDAVAERRGASFIDACVARAKDLGVFHPFLYMNYAGRHQNVIDGYGADSKAMLRAVSRKYDPKGLFQEAVPGGFKLSK